MFTSGSAMNNNVIETSWGYELVWARANSYCGKLLYFSQPGGSTNMVFHKEKDKCWFVNSGQFMLKYIDTATGELHETVIKEGDARNITPLSPHQLIALQPNSVIFETGTIDDPADIFYISRPNIQL